MAEPRYLIIDTETGRRVEITTDELQALVWRMELQQPLDGAFLRGRNMTQKQAQQTIPCPSCNGTMAATHTDRGVFFMCGECGNEIPVTGRGTVEE